jgi:hypothetical protein
VLDIRPVIALAAAAAFATVAYAEPTDSAKAESRASTAQSAKSAKQAPAKAGSQPHTIDFKRDVNEAWSQMRRFPPEVKEGTQRAGREIGAGSRSFGREARDSFSSGWRDTKEAATRSPEGSASR